MGKFSNSEQKKRQHPPAWWPEGAEFGRIGQQERPNTKVITHARNTLQLIVDNSQRRVMKICETNRIAGQAGTGKTQEDLVIQTFNQFLNEGNCYERLKGTNVVPECFGNGIMFSTPWDTNRLAFDQYVEKVSEADPEKIKGYFTLMPLMAGDLTEETELHAFISLALKLKMMHTQRVYHCNIKRTKILFDGKDVFFSDLCYSVDYRYNQENDTPVKPEWELQAGDTVMLCNAFKNLNRHLRDRVSALQVKEGMFPLVLEALVDRIKTVNAEDLWNLFSFVYYKGGSD